MEGDIFTQLKRVLHPTFCGFLLSPTCGKGWYDLPLGTARDEALVYPIVCKEFV